jgi:hypothetical protein
MQKKEKEKVTVRKTRKQQYISPFAEAAFKMAHNEFAI